MKAKVMLAAGSAAVTAVGVSLATLGGGAAAATSTTHGWPTRGATNAAPAAHAAPRITGGERLTFIAHQVKEQDVDTGVKGESPGDYFVFEEVLHNAYGGKVVGRDSVQCTALFTTFSCRGTLILNGRGTVEVSGALTENSNLIAVTGGTRNFRNVRGQLVVGASKGANSRLTLELLP